jgi:fibronectin type 3 domain-containing protein
MLYSRVRFAVVAALLLTSAVVPATEAAGATPVLARYPYLTDLTSSSVAVTWATTSLDSSPGVVTFGVAGSNCLGSVVSAVKAPSTYTAFGETKPYYQHTVQLTTLAPSTTYCYRVFSGTTAPGTPLLSEPPQFPTTFTTLPPVGSAASFSFDVLGDWGETSLTNNTPLGTYNSYQDALESQLAATARLANNPATFAVSTGDIAYSGGTASNYGDLNHPADGAGGAAEQSNVFDARYWAKVGGSLPLYATSGNHGRNNTFFSTWPTPTNVQASGGAYTATAAYPSVDGLPAGNYPSDWYAFNVANVRFYILDGDWTDLSQASYPTLGTACRNGSCPSYQAERDLHWQQTSAEYQWLSHDLQGDVSARGASALRVAFFHYPLRVDQNNYTTQQDVYLQNSAANPTGGATSLEALLSASHVNLAFNGHAHLYQRNVPPAGGVISYVTGGGGGVPTNVAPTSACSSTDAYARGWDPTHAVGSSCGAPAGGGTVKPTAVAQVYHFLKVTVSGTDITVSPTDSTGLVFDQVTYHFAPDGTPPSIAGAPTATRVNTTSTNVAVTLGTASSDNVAVMAYDVYRDHVYRATVPAGVAKWTDVNVPAGTHTWTVKARDFRDNASAESAPSGAIAIPDTTPPSPPTLVAVAQTSQINLSWSGATDDVAVTAYDVYRDGLPTPVAANVTASTWSDTQVAPGTTHSYLVVAKDAAGNISAPSNTVSATVPVASALGPPTGVTATQLASTGQVAVTWSPPATGTATSYDVSRDGQQLASGITSTSFTDPAAPDSTTISYSVTARDATGSSATATTTITPDWTAPTPPGAMTATPGSASSVTVTWSRSSDAVGVTSYTISRSDASGTSSTVAVVPGDAATSVVDKGLTAGASYTYTVTAADAAGNNASSRVSTTLPVFFEDFESGLLTGGANPWTAPTSGLAIEQSSVHLGSWAAEETSTGSPTWSSAQLPATYRAVHASAWVLVKTRSTSAGFFKLRSATGSYIAYLYVNAAGYLAVRNDAGGVTHVSTTPITNGVWHHVEMYIDTNPGGSITISASVDSTDVTFTTPVGTTETLGNAPIGRLTLGDDVAGRTYDVAIDDLTVDTTPLK